MLASLVDPNGGLPAPTTAPGVDEELLESRLDMMNQFNKAFDSKFQNEEVKASDEFHDNARNLMSSEDLDGFDLARNLRRSVRGMVTVGSGRDSLAPSDWSLNVIEGIRIFGPRNPGSLLRGMEVWPILPG